MYKYEEPYPQSISEILELYTQEDIFKIVFNDYPDYNNVYLSPFRSDRHPNCYFEWYKGRLLFKDYADVRRDCLQAIKDYYNLPTYKEVFTFIHDYFKSNKPANKVTFNKIREKRISKKFYDIVTYKRDFELRDNLYWKQYFITKEQLDEDLVFPISQFRFFSPKKQNWFNVNPIDIAYAITGFKRAKKIYRPRNYNFKSKWLTNCTENDVGNINNISKKLNYLIITKSYKDHRVIRNEDYTNVVWFQSETMYPNDDILLDLVGSYPYIFIFYDNDEAGRKGSDKLKNHILKLLPSKNIQLIFSPFKIFKDPASIVSNKGKFELQQILWKNCQV
jgi:hypothetical protein